MGGGDLACAREQNVGPPRFELLAELGHVARRVRVAFALPGTALECACVCQCGRAGAALENRRWAEDDL